MAKSATATVNAPAIVGAQQGSAITTPQIIATLGQSLPPVANSQEFPALQAAQYVGIGAGQSISICLNADSTDLLTEQALIQLALEAAEAVFDGKLEMIGVIKAPVRWVIITRPEEHLLNKNTKPNKVAKMPERYQLRSGTGIVSCARVLLAGIIATGGNTQDFIRNEAGGIQVFSLKLKSNGTRVIGTGKGDFGQAKNGGMLTITGLNNALAAAYSVDPKCWWTHLASVTLGCVGVRRESATVDESSVAAAYVFGGPAEPLAPEQQAEMTEFINTPTMRDLFADPFRLNRANAAYDGPDPFADAPAIVAVAPDSEAF